MSEWQPIGTAPLDGQEILACKAGSDEVVEMISWNFVLQSWLDRNAEPYFGATHWMKIPPIPQN
ncbi:hypothetical protein [Beijerinckia mobilis]|uniref:hypothetical protein n=1 Tax=Beijerinckia mobilis TaxID=231434 RepID=UPI00055797B9|nr:hypothetical protein [Beijerinckia mobilis]